MHIKPPDDPVLEQLVPDVWWDKSVTSKVKYMEVPVVMINKLFKVQLLRVQAPDSSSIFSCFCISLERRPRFEKALPCSQTRYIRTFDVISEVNCVLLCDLPNKFFSKKMFFQRSSVKQIRFPSFKGNL